MTATPDPGWALDRWLLNGSDVGSANPYEVTMDTDYNLTAVFEEAPYLFEDGFESGGFGAWSGTSTSSGETATVVDTRYHHGGYGARFASDGGDSVEEAYGYQAVDLEEVYLRGYFYLEGGLPLADEGDRFYLMRLRNGAGTSLAYAGVRRSGGVDKWMIYTRDGWGWMSWVHADSPLPEVGGWYCVELHWVMGSPGLVELYVDGVKVVEASGIDTSRRGSVGWVDFGLIYAAGVESGLTVYGDCAAVSQSYIGPE